MPPTELEIWWETSFQTDPENQNISELESFLTCLDVFTKKMQLLNNLGGAQKDFDECDVVFMATARLFASTVQTEASAEQQTAYALELIDHTFASLNKSYDDQKEIVLNARARREIQKILSYNLTKRSPDESCAVIEQLYGDICAEFIAERH